jgi:hypothetical protein
LYGKRINKLKIGRWEIKKEKLKREDWELKRKN